MTAKKIIQKKSIETTRETGASEKEEKPEQAVVNIGMVGHVDHGKCIAADEPLLLNNDVCNGLTIMSQNCKGLASEEISQSERLFDIPGFRAFSLNQAFENVSVPAKFFVQNYSGEMLEIITKDGKRIKSSPEHPLLCHNGTEIFWKKSKDLKKGEYVGALKKIPESSILKDPFPEWRKDIEKNCWIVPKTRAKELEKKTRGFSYFNNLSITELNEIRILKQISINSLERGAGLFSGCFSNSLKKSSISERHKNKIATYLNSSPTKIPEGTLINFKKKSQAFIDVRQQEFEDETLQFLAFIIAEGHITECSIRTAQSKNVLLEQFFSCCLKNFGIAPKYRGRFDYHIDNKALVLFLKARYGITIGNSRRSGIPNWVFSMPTQKLAVFLRTFFSAEGTINKKSGQLSLIQANRQSIILLGYALKKFGISHSIHSIKKAATNSNLSKKREYWQIMISNAKSLELFKEKISFDFPEKQKKLEELCAKPRKGKTSDYMIPVQMQVLSELTGLLGLKKKNFSMHSAPLKERDWFFAYQDCRSKNSASEEKLGKIILFLKERLKKMEIAVNAKITLQFLSEWGISQNDISKDSGLSPKKVFSAVHSKTAVKSNNKEIIAQTIRKIIETRKQKAKNFLEKLESNSPKNIEWCKIKSIIQIKYLGPIIDLQVPGYSNFACGTGALISHNTSLTQALTGKWTETHSEELKRGISIRLGYADTIFYKCPKCSGSEAYTSKPVCPNCRAKAEKIRTVSFVDAPGHETLLTTMLSGAALMHGAILVIAANETCPQPQTTEHLIALKIAGIKNLVVAQNKIDLADKKQALENYNQIKKFLETNGFQNAPIVPVAANFGTNIDLLIETIEKHIPTPKFELEKPLKLYCVRSFDVNKPGTKISELKGGVLGGSIIQGKIRIGDKIEITPGIEGTPVETTVKSLNCAQGYLQEAGPGGLIGIGTMLDPSVTQNDRMRGQVIALPKIMPLPAKKICLRINFIERLIASVEKRLRTNDALVLTIGAMTALGTVIKEKSNVAEIELKFPAVVESGQKIAVSRKEAGRWRLIGYGLPQ